MLGAAWGQKTCMPISIEQNDGSSLISIEGTITISSAAELKLVILQGLALRQKLSFDLQNAAELDITALQLLWATEREANIIGLPATITGQVPDHIDVAAVNAGFRTLPMSSK
jgi:anti-anti-sigma regulatory factor